MKHTEALERVMTVLAETLEVPQSELSAGTRIREDLGADSMQVVTLVMALDEAFDLEFNMEDIPREGVTIDWVARHVMEVRARQGG